MMWGSREQLEVWSSASDPGGATGSSDKQRGGFKVLVWKQDEVAAGELQRKRDGNNKTKTRPLRFYRSSWLV